MQNTPIYLYRLLSLLLYFLRTTELVDRSTEDTHIQCYFCCECVCVRVFFFVAALNLDSLYSIIFRWPLICSKFKWIVFLRTCVLLSHIVSALMCHSKLYYSVCSSMSFPLARHKRIVSLYVKMNLFSVYRRRRRRRRAATVRHCKTKTTSSLCIIFWLPCKEAAAYEKNEFRLQFIRTYVVCTVQTVYSMNVWECLMRELKIECVHDSLRFNSAFYYIVSCEYCDPERKKLKKKICTVHT